MSTAHPRLTVTEKVGYGFGDLASNLFWQMFSIFIAKFYTDVFLLGAATMGTMFLVTRIFDSITDPLMGTIADRTSTRWGKFRPYLLWMSVPMALTAVLTFTTPSFDGTAKIVYAYLTMSLMMLAYTAINIPYSALLGVLTPDSKDRTSASSYRFVMALLPVFIIVNTAIPMVEWFGDGDANSPRGWQMTMVVYSVAAVLLFWATFALTTERVQPPPEQKSSLKEDVRNLFRNRPWVVLSAVGIAALTYANIRGTVAVFYFEYTVPGGKDLFGPIMTTGAAAFIAGVMLTSPLAKIFGKRNFYMASMAVTALLTIGFYYVPTDNVPLVWGAHALISFVAAPTAPLVWAMYADSADYSEWKFHRRATGLVFSAASFAQKLGWATGGAGTGWLLAYFGYVPNVAQSPETIDGLKLMMSFIPAAGAVVAIAALWFYPLDEATVERMSRELEERRAREGTGPALPPHSPLSLPLLAADPFGANPAHRPIDALVNPNLGVTGHRSASAPREPAFAPHQGPGADDRPAASAPPPLSPQERAALTEQLRSVLQRGVHGLCFSPYVEGQAPGAKVSAAQIRARLQIIRPHARWIRTFSCTDGHEQTPRIAHELGLRTLVGAWLGTDRASNEREIESVIRVARAGHADIVAVGNEVLLRGDLTEDELIACIERVRQALPGVPIGYVDAYFLFEKHPRVTAACDVVLTNCYPFWEGCPREQAVAYMQSMLLRTRAVAGNKRVIVSETGWPDQGSAFHGAVPSVEGAMRYFVDTQLWAQQDGIEVFYFAAFDETWKVGAEGDVGAYWGLWDKDGRPKFT
jgi:GPH family glycoside/pentoside/hexuronide:cation symporter